MSVNSNNWPVHDHKEPTIHEIDETRLHGLLKGFNSAHRLSFARAKLINLEVAFVTDGVVGVERDLSDGRQVICALFHTGDLIDIRRDDHAHLGLVKALSEVRLLALDATEFDTMVLTSPEFAALVIKQIRGHFVRLRDHSTNLACKTPIERLAAMLIEFSSWSELRINGPKSGWFRIPVRFTDLAQYLGVKAETLSRCAKRMATEQLAEFQRSAMVRIIDQPRLMGIANGGRPRGTLAVRSNGCLTAGEAMRS